eukprot:CAMPEP_0201160006 /NCGR_PEP_ID=MMETSP0851-20130426/42234_1 /ASSEMBLY_ACC=CAM_ASM_000631 /TAXON_ID=183588 /ORGANISM="Pseudo-nitzschia fraudulenta, Strain WWA7" /LENGTH=286 /DNA_ID=CAMNT_0047439095 /DNA_START=197 /DNA_END=1054 /DNA_ORIENTATION=-
MHQCVLARGLSRSVPFRLALSQAKERAAEGRADERHPDVPARDDGVHVPEHLVAVGVVVVVEIIEEQTPAHTDCHPENPDQEDQDVHGHPLVVAQDVLDPLEGIGPARGLFATSVGDGTEVRFAVAALLLVGGGVQSRRGADSPAHSRIVDRRRGPYDLHDVKGSDHVAGRKGRVDHQPPEEGIRALVIRGALHGQDDRWSVQEEGYHQVRHERGAHQLAELVAARAAMLTGAREGFAALRDEFTDGLTENGRHDCCVGCRERLVVVLVGWCVVYNWCFMASCMLV